MKLDEIVNPERKAYLAQKNAEIADAIQKIKADCQPFIRECGGKPLFRGMKKPQQFLRLPVRTDRKPSDSSKFAHDIMDAWFEKKFGIKARSGTVFCTSRFKNAAHYSGVYGGAFMIFPIGDFKFVWSPKLYDLFMQTHTDNVMFEPEDDHGNGGERYPDDEAKANIEKLLDNGDYQDSNLSAAIASENEVMIQCKEYYAFRVDVRSEATAFMKKLMK